MTVIVRPIKHLVNTASSPMQKTRGWEVPSRRLPLVQLVRTIRATPHLRDHARLLGSARMIGKQRDPVQAAESESADPFTQFALLALATDGASSEGGGGQDSRRQASIDAAMLRLEEAHPALRARVHAMNAALTSNLSDALPGGEDKIHQACDAYEKILFRSSSLGSLFDIMIDLYMDRFESMRVWLMKTLSSELQSGWLSGSVDELLTVRQRLYDAQTLGRLMDDADRLLSKLTTITGVKADKTDKGDPKAVPTTVPDRIGVVREIIRLCGQSYVSTTALRKLCHAFGEAHVTAGVAWCQGLQNLTKSMPLGAFPDGDCRNRLLDAWMSEFDRWAQREGAAS